jgi:hypothetical protein
VTGYGVIAFESTHLAMQAERRLREAFPIAMMPTPRSITASCGISVRFSLADLDAVAEAMRSIGPDGGWQVHCL